MLHVAWSVCGGFGACCVMLLRNSPCALACWMGGTCEFEPSCGFRGGRGLVCLAWDCLEAEEGEELDRRLLCRVLRLYLSSSCFC